MGFEWEGNMTDGLVGDVSRLGLPKHHCERIEYTVTQIHINF